MKHSPSQGPVGMGWEVRAAWHVPLTRSRCITWSCVMLPYLVAFFMGCGRNEGGRSYQHWPLGVGPRAEPAAGVWVRVWIPRCSTSPSLPPPTVRA